MTTMRAMQKDIGQKFNSLGGDTFELQKWPGVFFGGPNDAEKYWRRKEISQAQGQLIANRATLPLSTGLDTDFNDVEVSSRYNQAVPGVGLNGDTPGSFGAQNWVI